VEISDVRINLADDRSAKLQAFATITIDASFVVRDLKIISGAKGLFVAMPSRKLTTRCPRCRCKNHLRAQFCNECGARLRQRRTQVDDRGRAKLHADIAHPINQSCRDQIQKRVLDAFAAEVERSKCDGYRPPREYADDAGPEGSDDDEVEDTSSPAREDADASGPPPPGDKGDMGIFG
jgi:stage V sporulation protein G